ncbi:MAG: hypothetical protein IKL27_04060 [Oscillospiraceae bacterium]|nr:hypothetical protein [Oscillospiraceae bacterium]
MAAFYNQATLTYNGQSTTSNITVGEIRQTLSVTKTAVGDSYTPGDRITYVVSIVNTGATAFNGLTLTDNLGEYTFGEETRVPLDYVDGTVLYYVNGVLQAAPTVEAGPPLVITGINVPAGGNATIVYDADVNEFAPLGLEGFITNTVTASGGGLSADVVAQETVNANTEPSLTITKSLDPVVVPENGQLTYTFMIQNTGSNPVTAEDNAVLTDVFDPVLTITAVTFNGGAWTEPANYTYNETTGEFATVPGQITVPAATVTQDPTTGAWSVTPGVSVLTVTGTI